jgi:threonine synthase
MRVFTTGLYICTVSTVTMQTVQQYNSLAHLSCSQCGQVYSAFEVQTFAPCCNQPLVADYELPTNWSKASLRGRVNSMWRYREVLPVFAPENIVSLGEGMTPILSPKNLREHYDLPNLYIKDESNNPTGSFKARGLSAAVSKAKEFGAHTCIIPTAGNAGGALAAYCAAAGMKAIVVMPRHTPQVFKDECKLYDAELVLVDGLISDCAAKVAELKQQTACFDISTLKEPYRLEGKKTMGYEIAEQFDWILPDVILYPTGGGTGLIGMWKAFDEMEQMGWIGHERPRMIAVQATTCQPIVHTWTGAQANAKGYKGRPSIANGLAVPNPFAENMILKVLRASGGVPIAVQDADMIAAVKLIAREEGLLVAPEGGALWKALLDLIDQQLIQRHEKILMLNTGSGYKYLENIM